MEHQCKTDKDGYCGDVPLICMECKHKGLVSQGKDWPMRTEDAICPNCNRKVENIPFFLIKAGSYV